jgi:hypothetical protein
MINSLNHDFDFLWCLQGMHSPDAAPVNRVTDLSLDSRKARQYLPFLTRQRDIRAVVEYVFSGSRFKVRPSVRPPGARRGEARTARRVD